MRRSHASKIDAWAHQIAAETRHLPRFHGKTRDLGPWFWCGDARRFGDLLGLFGFEYIRPNLRLTYVKV